MTTTICANPPVQRATSIHDLALLLVPGIIWGASFLFIAQGLEAIAPDGVTFLRFLVGFVALSLVPGARRPIAKSDRWKVGWLAVWWLAFPMSMFPHAEQHVTSALTGMMNGAVPLLATAVAAVFARKLPSRIVLCGLAVGFGGCVLMAVPALGARTSSTRGVLLICAAVVSYGVAINLARPLQQRNGALPVVWRALAVALVLTAPLGLPALWHAHWNAGSLLAVLALGVLGTAAANVVMAIAAGRLGATRASTTAFLIPVVALLLGVLFRDEVVPSMAIAGVMLCLAGAWIVRCEA